ncbi:MAG TPA: rod shape-determining protein MreC [Candidatus Paceibacterota bacterium]|nr:rod shape-determining protein MreC [Candidatus Paceibacterota bacterium]
MIRRDQNKFISYRDRNFRSYRKRIVGVLAVVVVVVGIFFVAVGPRQTLAAIASVGNSIFKVKRSAGQGISEGLELSKSKSTLINEKSELDEKVKDLEAKLAALPTLLDENAKLTEMLARKKEGVQLIMARILIKPSESIYDTIVVDAGTEEGIVVGAKVLARGDTPIGTVAEADQHSAKIKLFSTSGEITKAVIVGKDIFIDLKGQGGGTFETTLPRDIVIEKGTTVATLDSGETIAFAEESLADSRDPFQRVLFRSPVNIFELRFVGVEK